ncbi:MAG: hypothetical protein J7647_03650 [Cyanobacteria bacterium SBLK]|nr:hypothetical protein [Cyanobacteria bacterium SBLK]
MPAQSDPNQLETDLRLLDRPAFIPPSDLDRPLANSPSAASNEPALPPPPNNQPKWEFNAPLDGSYTLSDTLVLAGWVEDFDGIADVDRLDFELIVNGDRFDLGGVSQFVTDPLNSNSFTFRHQFDLKNLAIAEGFHDATLEGTVYDRSDSQFFKSTGFNLSNFLPDFQPHLAVRDYGASDTLRLDNTWVEDGDGLSDLSHIDFKLRRLDDGDNFIVDLPDATEFIADGSFERGQFSYSLDLSTVNLPVGNFEWNLEGTLFDKAGNSQYWEQIVRTYNHAPQNFHFQQSGGYQGSIAVGETVSINGGVEDIDGGTDIDRIELELIIGDRVFEIGQITEFISTSDNSQINFHHSFDLSGLGLEFGHHYGRLAGIVYDRAGNGTGHAIDFQVFNHRPNFNFFIDRFDYGADETIAFNPDNSWVEDPDGLSNLSHIDLHLRPSSGGEELIIDLDDITDFTFNGAYDRSQLYYQLDLSTLNLPLGEDEWVLGGHLFDKAGNSSDWFGQGFRIYNYAPSFQFDFERREYSANETITLFDTQVEDRDNNLDRIDFKLVVENNGFEQTIDLPDVTEFLRDHQYAPYSHFAYTIDLSTLPLPIGDYNVRLESILYDTVGNHAFGPLESFSVRKEESAFSFELHRDRYSANEILTLRNPRIDRGIGELEYIDFRAIVLNENNRVIDVADTANLIPRYHNASDGTFDYRLDLTELNLAPDRPHNIRLLGIAHTKAGMASSYTQDFRVDNVLPSSLQFQLDRLDYTSRDTLTLFRGGVFDDDSPADIERIDFRLRTDNGIFIDLPDVTTVTENPDAPGWTMFDYSFDLSSLPLAAGTYNLTLEAIAFDRSGNGSSLFGQAFQFHQENAGMTPGHQTHLNFALDRQNYAAGDILTLENVFVEDLDGIADIDRIDFIVQNDRNTFIDIADVTQFIRNPNDPNLATFNYELDLRELNLEFESDRNYTLIATVYDRFGRSGQQQFAHFDLRNYAPNFAFDFDSRPYSISETLTLGRAAWVEDPDGLDNLDRIEFEAMVNGYEIIDLPDVTEFIPDSGNPTRGFFEYDLDLWQVPLQPYHFHQDIRIFGTLYDRFGNASQTIERNISIDRGSPRFEYRIEERSQPYSAGDTLVLKDAWVRDFTNIADLDRIEFFAWGNGYEIALPHVTEFIASPEGNEAVFNYSIDLRDLKRDPDNPYYDFNLEGILYDKAGYRYRYSSQHFQVNDFQPSLDFQIENENIFAAGDTLTLKNTRVEDPNGIADIDRVDFGIVVNGNKVFDLPDATQFFSLDPNTPQGTFNYQLDLKTLGLDVNRNYDLYLEGIIFDKAGNTSVHKQQFRVSNHLPFVDVSLDRNQYGFNDTLNLQGWVEDPDGIAEMDRIDLRLFVGNESRYIDLADITDIGIDSGNPQRGAIDYDLDLSSLGLGFGHYDLFLDMTAYDKAGNGTQGMTQSFILANHNQIPQLNFNLSQGEYLPEETLVVTDGWVEDLDGFTNIDRIEFSLRNLISNEIIDLADIGTLIADPMNFHRGTFDYSLKLETLNLAAGNYALEGIIYDKQGNRGSLFERQFAIGFGQIAPQELRFNLDNSTYAPNETIFLEDGWVKDENSGEDIARVDLRLLDADNNLVADLNDVTSFELASWDSLWAGFSGAVDLNGLNLADGIYTLSAIAYDYANQTSNWFERDFEVQAPTPNFAPANLTFGLDGNSYKLTDTIHLTNGWVRDENGANTLDRIDLRILTEQGTTLDIDDITDLSPTSWNQEWASFQFNANLQGLNLQGGSHKLIGIAYDAEGAASEQFERGFFLEVPQPNLAPSDLRFTLDRNTYRPTDTLTLSNGWISDGDGAEDIESVRFKLVDGNGSEIELGAMADFSIASWSPEWASFAGSFDLSQYNLSEGNYTLIGIARDKSGGKSQSLSREFTIETPQTNNTAPANLQFALSGNTFSASDTLEITNGWVSDGDGNHDLAGVDFELVAEDGTIIELEDSFDLSAATWDSSKQWSSFRYNVDFSLLGLTSGIYTLRGKAYDRAGDYSNTFSRSFTFV